MTLLLTLLYRMQIINNEENQLHLTRASQPNNLKILIKCIRFTCTADIFLTLYFNVILTNIYYNNRYIDYLGGFLILASILYKTIGTVKLKEFTLNDMFMVNKSQKFTHLFKFYSTPYKISIALQYCLVLISCFQYFYNNNILNYIALGVVHASLHIKELSSVLAIYNSLKFIIDDKSSIDDTDNNIDIENQLDSKKSENNGDSENSENNGNVSVTCLNATKSKIGECIIDSTVMESSVDITYKLSKQKLIDELKFKLGDI